MGKKRKKVCLAAPLCVFGTIWKERNDKTFNDKE